MNNSYLVSLPEEDYLKVIDIIQQLYRCETRDHLNEVLKNHLFPLLNVQTLGSSWTDFDIDQKTQAHGTFLYQLGISDEEAEIWQKVYPYHKEITRLFTTRMQPVLATNIDLTTAQIKSGIEEYFTDHPQDKEKIFKTYQQMTHIIVMADPPEFNIGLGLTRTDPHEQPFTLREIRMAELIRPGLIRALKFIAINQELNTCRSLVEALAEVPTPISLIHSQGVIAFGNAAFETLTGLKKGDYLPDDLMNSLKDKEQAMEGLDDSDSAVDPVVFFHFPGGEVRCTWTRLSQPGTAENNCWVLKLKPVLDPYSQTLWLMKQAGLTPREIEVAVRVRDGFDDKAIARRLFISPQTIKNHLKGIYKKLNVSSRTQLIAKLKSSE